MEPAGPGRGGGGVAGGEDSVPQPRRTGAPERDEPELEPEIVPGEQPEVAEPAETEPEAAAAPAEAPAAETDTSAGAAVPIEPPVLYSEFQREGGVCVHDDGSCGCAVLVHTDMSCVCVYVLVCVGMCVCVYR